MTDTPLLAIGELSRASGLTVSALRFYDRECVLVPADVDPHTGYRRYSPGQIRHARLLAGMRRVGMPLAEMAAVLEALPDTAAVEDLLEDHLRRLEDGLADARREITRLRSLLPGQDASCWTVTLAAGELGRALDAVRYAVGTDPAFPMLCGALLEPVEGGLRLVATDRYRLAVAHAAAQVQGAATGRMPIVPSADLDRWRRVLWETTADATVRLDLDRTAHRVTLPGGHHLTGECLDLDFPDYRRLLHDPTDTGPTTQVPVADILASLAQQEARGVVPDRVALRPTGLADAGAGLGGGDEPTGRGEADGLGGGDRLDRDGVEGANPMRGVASHMDGSGELDGQDYVDGDDGTQGPDTDHGLLLDRTFLWEAASAAGHGHAVLPAAGVIAPLVFRDPDDELIGLLMPVQPEANHPVPSRTATQTAATQTAATQTAATEPVATQPAAAQTEPVRPEHNRPTPSQGPAA